MRATNPTAPRPVFGTVASFSISRAAGRRAGDDVAADGDEGHLHRERNEAPEAEAELLGDLHRPRTIDHRAGRDDHQRHRDEDEGIREPLLGPAGKAEREAGHVALLCTVAGGRAGLDAVSAHSSPSSGIAEWDHAMEVVPRTPSRTRRTLGSRTPRAPSLRSFKLPKSAHLGPAGREHESSAPKRFTKCTKRRRDGPNKVRWATSRCNGSGTRRRAAELFL